MKNTLSLVALAAGLSQVTATGFGFHNAPKFTCPANTDNICIPDIVKGIDWSDLPFGGFDSYKGFKWSGFTCAQKFGKRDELTARTFQSKCATGKATSDKNTSPKISCDKSKGVNKTSIKKFQVSPEFDCDLEFHYTMPDKSTCKHRSPCKASGTVVENTQCGGATEVVIVYPEQPKKPKKTCDFGIHHIDFDCEAPKPPKPVKPSSSSSYVVSTPPYATVSTPSATKGSSTSTVSTASSYSASTVSSSSSSSSSVSETSSTSATVATSSSTVLLPSSYPIKNGTSSTEAASSSYSVTSYLSTSTVFTTSVQTITSCAPTVSNCPAGSTVLTTVTVPVSTTICPVTETVGVSKPAESTGVVSTPTATASTSLPIGSSTTSPAGPVETLPCPGVVPSCLNTWMFSVGCKDNTDSACYCPDAAFTKNIFTCLYAYGESDEVISEAISYFQGICAPFVPSNPGIATGAETITSILTASPTAPPAAVTTIEVATTVVVPCTNEAGETIPSSSSTVTVSMSLTVPGVSFSTITSGPSSTGVAVVPGTYPATVPAAAPTPEAPVSTPVGGAPLYPTGSTTLLTSAPVGTGAVYPSSTPIVTAGAARIGAGMGFLGFAAMVVAAL
ncbi:hypothetical protein GGS26DRAFT_551192 [Hypomontagnella submonticulosa]|nr:hypothetical protein GGS26DRAFT_551192 [Hypomontagnella submonticulosa]